MDHRAQDIVRAAHSLLVDHGLLCCGTAEKKSEEGSRELPEGWAAGQDVWTLCYHHAPTDSAYEVKAVKMGDVLLVHVLAGESVHSCEVSIGKCVSSGSVSTEEVHKAIGPLLAAMGVDAKVSKEVSEEETKNTQKRSTVREGLLVDPPQRPAHPTVDPLAEGYGRPDLTGPYGGYGDLDRLPHFGGGGVGPFGGVPGGGGMIMRPSRVGIGSEGYEGPGGVFGIPRGSVPRGARFDPFGPPVGGPRGWTGQSDPDPDHLPPPRIWKYVPVSPWAVPLPPGPHSR